MTIFLKELIKVLIVDVAKFVISITTRPANKIVSTVKSVAASQVSKAKEKAADKVKSDIVKTISKATAKIEKIAKEK